MVFRDGVLCDLQWQSGTWQQLSDGALQPASGVCSIPADFVLSHPWTVDNILLRLEEITRIQKILRTTLENCPREKTGFEACNTAKALERIKGNFEADSTRRFRDLGISPAPAVASAEPETQQTTSAGAIAAVLPSLSLAEAAAFETWRDTPPLEHEKIMFGAFASRRPVPPTTTATAAAAVPEAATAISGFGPIERYLTTKDSRASDSDVVIGPQQLLRELTKSYLYYTILSPYRTVRTRPDGADEPIPMFDELKSSDPNVIGSAASNITSKIRNDRINSILHMVERFCADDIMSPFCLSIPEVRTMMDELVPSLLFTAYSQTYTEQSWQRKCKRKTTPGIPGVISVTVRRCKSIAVEETKQRVITRLVTGEPL